ncbi:hypothetical protein FRACYDRAFT_233568 [Fragilariopsis cylindrus CCMP1102]|uniref:Uncharacterized protein n=1 Tax=Fragilariopsis cylindrus CCMP1102 TaxID=635003 RepID=A0A1E7FZ30_9STRA|nr:hypothetical protein FRACYDRAFT_233568 [Fragilariopsis cylindrus CCMP1102]|eukprot:OEU23395.1 hypothetical protein FRACYDRAFT_233568 [Fragilariopsis cylindrus CCMP1102]
MTKTSPKSKKKSPVKAKVPADKAKKGKATSKNQLLGVIAQLAPLHKGKPPRDFVARRAGYGRGDNASFKKALSRAKKRDHVDLSDKMVVFLTDLGRDEAGNAPEVETNKQAQETILSELTAKMKTVFEILQDGKVHQRLSLAKTLDYASAKEQGFKKLLDRIRLKGYLDNVDKESVQLSDTCYPNGRVE